jgi:hypothetical protein
MKNCLRVFFQKFITKDWIWVLFDCTINRISEYAIIQRNEVLKNRVDLLVSKHGVLDGPFSGMRYVKRAHGSVLLPKLLGTYETEVHSIVLKTIQKSPEGGKILELETLLQC